MKNSEARLISFNANVKKMTNYFNFSDKEREALILETRKTIYLITDQRYSGNLNIKNIKVLDYGVGLFLDKEAKKILKKHKINSLYVEENSLTLYEFNKLKSFVKIIPTNFNEIRLLKTDFEIKQIKKACKIGDKAYSYILKELKLGNTEKEIETKLVSFFRLHSAEPSFRPIIAFGANSSIPHHNNSNIKLKKNQIVVLDFGVKINGYCSDMTRTVFFGKADYRFKKMYNTVADAQIKAIKTTMANEKASAIDLAARKYIIKQGFKNIPHAVGHGIGIEVHEPPTLSPKSKDLVQNGMVFSIEPGIYDKSYGGVRIEDLFYIKNNKAHALTKASKKLIEI